MPLTFTFTIIYIYICVCASPAKFQQLQVALQNKFWGMKGTETGCYSNTQNRKDRNGYNELLERLTS